MIESYTKNQELRENLSLFFDGLKKAKKAITKDKLKLMFENLDTLAKTDSDKIAVVKQSIRKGWFDFYELRSNTVFERKFLEMSTHVYDPGNYDADLIDKLMRDKYL